MQEACAHCELWCRTLGELALYRSPGDPTPLMRAGKPLAILVYLALTPRARADRDRLAGLLWPGVGRHDAHHSLRQSLYRLRLTTDDGDTLARMSGTEVVLQPRVRFDCLEGERAAESQDWQRACALLRGNFLEGFTIPESREFEEWAESQRARFGSTRAAAARALGELRLQRGEAAGALETAEELLALQPFDDEALHLLMRALAALGRHTTAIAQFRAYASCLRAEMDDEPGAEVAEYARELERLVRSRPLRRAAEPGVDGQVAGSGDAAVTQVTPANGANAFSSAAGVNGDGLVTPPAQLHAVETAGIVPRDAPDELPGSRSIVEERRTEVRPPLSYVNNGLGPDQTAVVEAPPGDRLSRRPVRIGRRAAFALAALFALGVSALVMWQLLGRTSAEPIASAESPVVPSPLANDAASEECPSLSPDGSRVVYFWRRGPDPGLYIKPIDGPPRRLLTDDAGNLLFCGYPRWSPTGDLIAFLANGAWVISPAGGRPRRVTTVSGLGLAWSPDGQSLAFVDRNSPGEPFSIFMIPLRGGPRRRLTNPPLGTFGDTHAAFSPDGRRLAVIRHPNRYQSDVFVISVNAPEREHAERLTTGYAGMHGIDWSPDGRAIVVGSQSGLWKIPLTGARKPARVVPFNGAAFYPTFSRAIGQGSSIRLVYQSDITDVNIWRWDLARREARKIAGSTLYDDFPAVAPGGDRVAFASYRTGDNEIWVADIDGSDPRQLTFHRGPIVMAPAWSPDGKWLAFSSEVAGNRDIYVMWHDGSTSTRITTAPSEETNPSWSPDGRWIYFRSDQAGIGQLWKMPAAGGTPIRVTTGEALQAFPSPDGQLVYFVRGAEAPGLWSVPVDGGRETFIHPDVRDGLWAVADSGIFFIVSRREGSTEHAALRFFAFGTGTVSTLPAPPEGWARGLKPGFSAARDGRFVLWTRTDNTIRDLMLIDPWRP